MLIVAAGLAVARGILVGAVPPAGAVATAEAYDIVVRFLRNGLRTLFALGLVIAAGAFLAGPSTTAVSVRAALARFVGWLRRGGATAGLRTGPVGPWVHSHLRLLRIAAVAIAVLIYVFIDRPNGFDILLITTGLVVVLGILQFLDQPLESTEPTPAPT